jgi:hypothetical protein
MTREFSLVLLGAGVLTAGYFLWPEEDAKIQAQANEKMGRQVAGTRMHHGYVPIFIHTGRWAAGGAPPAASGAVSRGGFGGTGRVMAPVS